MKYIRRLLWFLASKLVIFSVIVAMLILAFYLSMNASNIYILLSDGMKQRAEVILMHDREEAAELNSFFMKDFLDNDEALKVAFSLDSPYLNYNITGFDSELTLEWIWSWPWENTAQATIVHTVTNIKGSALSSKAALVKSGQLSATPPVWRGGRYNMQLYRSGGQWKIAGMLQTQVILPPSATPTPAPTITPTQAP